MSLADIFNFYQVVHSIPMLTGFAKQVTQNVFLETSKVAKNS